MSGSQPISLVSIPERVWGGLEHMAGYKAAYKRLFQSLRGFGVGWSPTYSSPSPSTASFQSLRGFGVGWSDSSKNSTLNRAIVSIPERVWGGLEQLLAFEFAQFLEVSIPERVWGGLERAHNQPKTRIHWFQSLRGFGVGWSATTPTVVFPVGCFNP